MRYYNTNKMYKCRKRTLPLNVFLINPIKHLKDQLHKKEVLLIASTLHVV